MATKTRKKERRADKNKRRTLRLVGPALPNSKKKQKITGHREIYRLLPNSLPKCTKENKRSENPTHLTISSTLTNPLLQLPKSSQAL